MRIALNNGWEFTEALSERLFDPAFAEGLRRVRLPHWPHPFAIGFAPG